MCEGINMLVLEIMCRAFCYSELYCWREKTNTINGRMKIRKPMSISRFVGSPFSSLIPLTIFSPLLFRLK